jgi:hypothetical protein
MRALTLTQFGVVVSAELSSSKLFNCAFAHFDRRAVTRLVSSQIDLLFEYYRSPNLKTDFD